LEKEKKKKTVEHKEPKVEDVSIEMETQEIDKATQYLELAQRIGKISVIEVFLPCLDTFKTAKKNIFDEKTLQGIEMIENKILDALKSLGVEKINSVGEIYNPNLHEAISVLRVEDKENDIILDEYQAGYKYNDKIIRYAKVIVNKKED